jgi:hypothetical protein
MTETTQPDPRVVAVLRRDGWVIDGPAAEGDPNGEVYYDAAGNGWRIHKPTEPDTAADAEDAEGAP